MGLAVGMVMWGCPRLGPSQLVVFLLVSPLQSSALETPRPSRRLGWQTGLAWPGRSPAPGSARLSLPVSVCDPQPETEDEKKRFEEGKGRYLQMKAKRQGQVEHQP